MFLTTSSGILRAVHRQLLVRAPRHCPIEFEGHLDHRPFFILGPGSGIHTRLTTGPEIQKRVVIQPIVYERAPGAIR